MWTKWSFSYILRYIVVYLHIIFNGNHDTDHSACIVLSTFDRGEKGTGQNL